PDPRRRLTLEEVLEMPWVSEVLDAEQRLEASGKPTWGTAAVESVNVEGIAISAKVEDLLMAMNNRRDGLVSFKFEDGTLTIEQAHAARTSPRQDSDLRGYWCAQDTASPYASPLVGKPGIRNAPMRPMQDWLHEPETPPSAPWGSPGLAGEQAFYDPTKFWHYATDVRPASHRESSQRVGEQVRDRAEPRGYMY
ncbi:hypothetical protein HDU96_004245, partial [Phlyctochytrium bullatum]